MFCDLNTSEGRSVLPVKKQDMDGVLSCGEHVGQGIVQLAHGRLALGHGVL